MLPVELPKHRTFIWVVVPLSTAAGSVIVTRTVSVQTPSLLPLLAEATTV